MRYLICSIVREWMQMTVKLLGWLISFMLTAICPRVVLFWDGSIAVICLVLLPGVLSLFIRLSRSRTARNSTEICLAIVF